jgi:quercetin dioxygenase-like cupin family protein
MAFKSDLAMPTNCEILKQEKLRRYGEAVDPFASCFAGVLSAEAQTPAVPAVKLGSTVFRWEDFTAKPTPSGNGLRREVANLPTATFEKFESHITTLDPGKMSHPPHQHAREEFIIVKEGTLDVSLNAKVQRAGAGSLFFFAANDFHNMTNVGDTPATYFVFNLTTVATKSAPAGGATAAAVPGKLVSAVFDWQKLETKPIPTGTRREIVNSPTTTLANLEAHVTTLNPGGTPHAAHRHPDEEIVVVKEGLVEVTINGVTARGGPGTVFFFGSNDEHGVRNAGPTATTTISPASWPTHRHSRLRLSERSDGRRMETQPEVRPPSACHRLGPLFPSACRIPRRPGR